MKVVWSDFAERQLDVIFVYHCEKASVKIATKILQNLVSTPNKLIKNPFIGQIEKFLSARKESYRYLVHTNYKIIYSVDEDKKLIKIADVFDTRQNPLKLSRHE